MMSHVTARSVHGWLWTMMVMVWENSFGIWYSRPSPSLWYAWACTTCCSQAEPVVSFCSLHLLRCHCSFVFQWSSRNSHKIPELRHYTHLFFTSSSHLLARQQTFPIGTDWLYFNFYLEPGLWLCYGFFRSVGLGCLVPYLVHFESRSSSPHHYFLHRQKKTKNQCRIIEKNTLL